jgi:hypothetical protein
MNYYVLYEHSMNMIVCDCKGLPEPIEGPSHKTDRIGGPPIDISEGGSPGRSPGKIHFLFSMHPLLKQLRKHLYNLLKKTVCRKFQKILFNILIYSYNAENFSAEISTYSFLLCMCFSMCVCVFFFNLVQFYTSLKHFEHNISHNCPS